MLWIISYRRSRASPGHQKIQKPKVEYLIWIEQKYFYTDKAPHGKPKIHLSKKNCGVSYYTCRDPESLLKNFERQHFVKCLHTKSSSKAKNSIIELNSRLKNIPDRLRIVLIDFDPVTGL